MLKLLWMAVCSLPFFCFSTVIVSGPLSYVYSGKHGDKIEGKIQLYNQSEKPQRVMLKFYDYPYFDNEEQGYIYPEVGKDKRSNASWFQLEKNLVTIPGSSSYEVPVRGTFPENKKLEGSYYSILMIEPELEEIKFDEEKPMVRSLVRYALHMVTSLDETGEYGLKIISKNIKEKGEKKIFEFEVENTGSKYFRPNILIELYSQSGEKIEPFKLSPIWLLPTKTKKYEIDVTDLKLGKYQGMILFDQKGADFFGSNCEFELK